MCSVMQNECVCSYPRVHVKLEITNISAKTKDLFLAENNTYKNGKHSAFIVAS